MTLPLFLDADQSGFHGLSTTNAKVVQINSEALVDLRKAVHPKISDIRFNLFQGVDVELSTLTLESVGSDSWSWSGSMPGVPSVYGFLAASGSKQSVILNGSLIVHGAAYNISAIQAGYVQITQETRHIRTDKSLAPASSTAQIEQRKNLWEQVKTFEQKNQMAEGDDAAEINILFVYPPHTVRIKAPPLNQENEYDNFRALNNLVNLEINMVNTAFRNSNINARANFLNCIRSDKIKGNLVDNFTYELSDNNELREELDQLLLEHNADVIAVILSDAISDSGVAPLIPSPFEGDSVRLEQRVLAVQTASLGQGYSFVLAHELGHLLGASHDRYTSLASVVLDRSQHPGDPSYRDRYDISPLYDYARGYVPEDRSFYTIMAYWSSTAEGATLAPTFSSPDVTWKGQPAGRNWDQPYPADAARLLRSSTRVMANYKNILSRDENEFVRFTLSCQPEAGGMLLPARGGPYKKDPHGMISIQAQPRPGYRFDAWLLDGTELPTESSSLTVSTDHNHSIIARFATTSRNLEFRMHVSIPEAGDIICDPSVNQARYGDLIECSVRENNPKKYAFVGWRVDGKYVGATTPLFLQVCKEEHDVVAIFAERMHRVSVTTNQADVAWIGFPNYDRSDKFYQNRPDGGDPKMLAAFGVPDKQPLQLRVHPFDWNLQEDQFLATFNGWFMNGKFVSNKADCFFKIIEDTNIEARFENKSTALFKVNVTQYPQTDDSCYSFATSSAHDTTSFTMGNGFSKDARVSIRSVLLPSSGMRRRPVAVSINGRAVAPLLEKPGPSLGIDVTADTDIDAVVRLEPEEFSLLIQTKSKDDEESYIVMTFDKMRKTILNASNSMYSLNAPNRKYAYGEVVDFFCAGLYNKSIERIVINGNPCKLTKIGLGYLFQHKVSGDINIEVILKETVDPPTEIKVVKQSFSEVSDNIFRRHIQLSWKAPENIQMISNYNLYYSPEGNAYDEMKLILSVDPGATSCDVDVEGGPSISFYIESSSKIGESGPYFPGEIGKSNFIILH